MAKSASPSTVGEAGEVITYTFHVTNTGNVTVTDVTVTDPMSGLSAITCPTGALAPNDSVDCTATYTVTQADINAGSITNTATATATPPPGVTPPDPPSSTATVPVTQSPAVTMVKTANPATVSAAGQVVTYTFHVTNTGNVHLTDIVVDETAFSGTGIPPVVTCPPGPLAPTASVDCTATYTVTQADIDAGSVTNTATATATPPPGVTPPPVSPPSSATVSAPAAPALTILKTATPTVVTVAGQVVTYSFAVTNTGNVTMTDVTVTDTMPGLSSISCPTTTLAPGASMTCTATYTTTQADIDRGSITNAATAVGVQPDGVPMVSVESLMIVRAAPEAPPSAITPVTVPVTG
jgi:uncharacterized repeat protein (TIGR01451 family)